MPCGAPIRVLVADVDEVVRAVVATVFEKAGSDVLVACALDRGQLSR